MNCVKLLYIAIEHLAVINIIHQISLSALYHIVGYD